MNVMTICPVDDKIKVSCFNNKIFIPGIDRADSGEDELNESIAEEGGEEEKGKQTWVAAWHFTTNHWVLPHFSQGNLWEREIFFYWVTFYLS